MALSVVRAEETAVAAVVETVAMASMTPDAIAPERLEKKPPLASKGPATPAPAEPKPKRPPKAVGKNELASEPRILVPPLISPERPPPDPPRRPIRPVPEAPPTPPPPNILPIIFVS